MTYRDILGSIVGGGLMPSADKRLGRAAQGGNGDIGWSQMMDELSQISGGEGLDRPVAPTMEPSVPTEKRTMPETHAAPQQHRQHGGGIFGDILKKLGQHERSAPQPKPQERQHQSGGMLGEIMKEILQGGHTQKREVHPKSSEGPLGGILGTILGSILGGGSSQGHTKTSSSNGSGILSMLAYLAFEALKKFGSASVQMPRALMDPQSEEDVAALEEDARDVIRAMINAAKADGRVDREEVEKIIGKMDADQLGEEEKSFLLSELKREMDTEAIIASAGGDTLKAAQLYAASLLAIDVDTEAERNYLKSLAAGLSLPAEVALHIEERLGVRV